MDQVKLNNESLYHPSMFQSHNFSQSNMITDQNKYWNLYEKEKDFGGSTELPYTKREIEYMTSILKPKLLRSDNNTIPTLLYNTLFSERNIEILQKLIVKTVYKLTLYKIPKQSQITLLQVMDEIYEQFSQNVDELSIPRDFLRNFISKQVEILNNHVVDQSVPIIINGIEQHKSYLDKVDQPRLNLIQPQYTNITGTREYRSFDDLI